MTSSPSNQWVAISNQNYKRIINEFQCWWSWRNASSWLRLSLLNFGEAFSTQFRDCLPLDFRIGRVIYLSDAHDDDDDHMEMDTRTSPVKVQGECKVKWKHWLLHLRHLRVSVWWKIQVARLASIYDCGTDKFQVLHIQNLVSFQLIRAFSNAV